MKKTEKEKMITGEFYHPGDKQLVQDRLHCRELLWKIAQVPPSEREQRIAYFKDLFGQTGEKLWLELTFSCDYGYNIHLGENFYANFNCVMLDVAPIYIGDNVMFAPNVGLYTATHPVHPISRNSGLEYAKPITIGHNVWLGAGVIVNPGVTIGDNVVIGSGSVVTKDIPANVIAFGNPCKIVREITTADFLTKKQ